MKYLFLAFALALATVSSPLFVPPAQAVEPGEMLKDPALEARARDISEHLRCLVCQNESIDESNAQLARDLRLLVRERLKAGDSNKAVIDYIVARYGEFVLLQPRFEPHTYLLWLGAPLVLLVGIIAIVVAYRRRKMVPSTSVPLSDEERAELDRVLGETKKS